MDKIYMSLKVFQPCKLQAQMLKSSKKKPFECDFKIIF